MSLGKTIIISLLAVLALTPYSSLAADTGTLSVTATVLSNSTCRFLSDESTLNFGTLDPSNSTDANATTTINFQCWGNWGNIFSNITFYIDDDDGQFATGLDSPRMRNTTQSGEYLPYSLNFAPKSGTISFLGGWFGQTLTVTGTVTAANYRNAYVGNYRDTVRITIQP